MKRDVDLSALRMKEGSARTKRPVGPRVAVIVLVVVVVGVLLSFLIPLFLPVRPVTTVAVRVAETGTTVSAGATVAEAAGWIEPDPFPIAVRPLISGVLTELPVLEGREVKKGKTIIGKLESAELLARYEGAHAMLALSESERAEARAAWEWAKALLKQKADVRKAEAEARHHIEITRGKRDAARATHRAAEADRDRATADLEGQEALEEAGGSYPVALAKARAALAAATATVDRRKSEVDALEAEFKRDQEIFEIDREVLNDPRALMAKVELAKAAFDAAEAALGHARAEVGIAKREYAWMTVTAPVDGVVMKLLAAPGAHVGPNGEGIVELYDPTKLQARVDVPLAAVANVRVGQEVAVHTEVLPSRPAKGIVVRVQRESDLLKNTLQVKVRLIDPDPLLRPETLCRALFLATGEGGGDASTPTLFLVPKRAVRDGAVFVIGEGRARRIAVERVGDRGQDAVVRGALSATHQVILEEVSDGERVK